ncbi:hypothetical protein M1248_07810 [Mycobacterium sp. 29Ha]|nr:hypothetical protein [Mycobacterium sp. 29Ha]
MKCTKRRVFGAVTGVTALFTLAPLPTAAAQPAPPPPPFFPSPTLGSLPIVPGSYSATYYVILPPSPATTDSRGLNVASNADAASAAYGLPGSKLGNLPHKSNPLTSTNTRYGLSALGSHPPAHTPGVNATGVGHNPLLEDPSGQPPEGTPAAESEAPLEASTPAPPVLEDPSGLPLGALESGG